MMSSAYDLSFVLNSYFLGELEKCVAEPERLAQLFIKHVSLSLPYFYLDLTSLSRIPMDGGQPY